MPIYTDGVVRLKRYGPPNKMDTWPKGTLCEVINSLSNTKDLYEQTSENELAPEWELIAFPNNPQNVSIK